MLWDRSDKNLLANIPVIIFGKSKNISKKLNKIFRPFYYGHVSIIAPLKMKNGSLGNE